MILLKVSAVDILNNAQRVCRQWHSICNEPFMWRTIDMHDNSSDDEEEDDESESESELLGFDMVMKYRNAVHLSRGNLVDVTIGRFGHDNLIKFTADSARHLQRLRLHCCRLCVLEPILIAAVRKLPFLEELDITNCYPLLCMETLKSIGRYCPLLKSFKLNKKFYPFIGFDGDAFAIAQTMPNLRHLQLFGNTLTDEGLLAILDGCPLLESLDLRRCFNVKLGGSLRRRCAQQIKHFLEPYAPTFDYPFHFNKNYSFDTWSFSYNGI